VKRLGIWLALALVTALATVGTASAESAGGSADCGVKDIDMVSIMTKGRTDGMVATVNHTEHARGCSQTVKLRTLIGTGRDESYGYPGQASNCELYAREDVSRTFKYYFGVEVDPSSIKVTCSPYNGPD
jgi:hypothetical protein